jgi:hypothetical protein
MTSGVATWKAGEVAISADLTGERRELAELLAVYLDTWYGIVEQPSNLVRPERQRGIQKAWRELLKAIADNPWDPTSFGKAAADLDRVLGPGRLDKDAREDLFTDIASRVVHGLDEARPVSTA